MVRWTLCLLMLCVLFSGCTLTVVKPSGQVVTYRWPASTSPTPNNYAYNTPPNSGYRVSNTPYQQRPNYYAAPTTRVEPQTPTASPYYSQNTRYNQNVGQPNTASSSESTQRRDPFNSLMTTDQDRLDTALDAIIREYKRLYGDRAAQSIGYQFAPNAQNYIIVSRMELPVLAEPSITSDKLNIIGLARFGEYFPVLEQSEPVYTLGNPLSNRPSNAGKWCKVQTSSGQVGWLLAQPTGMGSKVFAQIVNIPPPPHYQAPNATSGGGSAGVVILILVVGGFLLVKLFSSNGSGVSHTSSGGGSYSTNSSGDKESNSKGWFTDVFHGRTESKPKQGFFEKHGDYRDRVYLEGKERIIEDATGTAPSRGFFESDDKYKSRVAHEANEAIVEKGSGSSPSQGFFENDDKYRERMSHEANEEIISAATGSEPSQGFFESDEKYNERITDEANEHIIEEATGSAPSQGFFESDDAYKTRISQEAKDIKASDDE